MNDRANDGKTGSGFHPSRRDFLTQAGLLAGGMALLGIPALRPQPAAAGPMPTAAGSSALELDGQFVDFLKSVEGGFPKSEVIHEPVGPNMIVKKHIGPPKFQDIAIQCDPLMPKPLFDWIAATLNMSYVRKNGAIITTDSRSADQSRLQFNNALITEFGIPACNGAAKDYGFLTVKFAPEFTTPLAGKGNVISASVTKTQKVWPPSNFRLTIPGLDCSKVSKIEALTIKQTLPQDVVGQMRIPQKEPAKLEFPNLVLSIAEVSAGTFYAWFQDMVLTGNSGENNEKAGTLELLDPTLTTLLTIYFHHLGIFGFAPQKPEANADAIRRVKVEMYCEQMTLTPLKT
jgi:hypothetical protein